MDEYLKIDGGGQLKMCEWIAYQGKVLKDYFQGQGSLILPEGIMIKGKWKKGRMIDGEIYVRFITELKSIYVNEETKNASVYKLKLKN